MLSLACSKSPNRQHSSRGFHAWRNYCLLSWGKDWGSRPYCSNIRKLRYCHFSQRRYEANESEAAVWFQESDSLCKPCHRRWDVIFSPLHSILDIALIIHLPSQKSLLSKNTLLWAKLSMLQWKTHIVSNVRRVVNFVIVNRHRRWRWTYWQAYVEGWSSVSQVQGQAQLLAQGAWCCHEPRRASTRWW